MGRQMYSGVQIINKLREAEILLNQGSTIAQISRKLGVTKQTYYRWKKEYGYMLVEIKSPKDSEKEIGRLESANDLPQWATDGKNTADKLILFNEYLL